MMLKTYDKSVEINHNSKWPYIHDHPYRSLIIGSSQSGKTNVLLNLIKLQQPDIDKIYLYVKVPFELKYQLLINRRKIVGIKKFKKSRSIIIEYSQTIDNVYEHLEEYKPPKKRKTLIVFDDLIANMETNKKQVPLSQFLQLSQFFLRRTKLKISFVFTKQSYFKVPKTIRVNTTHYSIMKIPNKREL